jgi:tetratricopeptide (TPR) repeat protein
MRPKKQDLAHGVPRLPKDDLMMVEARQASSAKKKSAPPILKGSPEAPSAGLNAAMQQFHNAVNLLQQGKYDKAAPTLALLAEEGPSELKERSRTYLAVCRRFIESKTRSFATLEEQYDYAISLLNTGDYEEARDQLNSILAEKPEADFAWYGLAVLDSLTCSVEQCLTHLARAIELNGSNRIQARGDSDFQEMADDPRFTELLYPELP